MRGEVGQKFGRLTIIARADAYKTEAGTISRYLCRCDCGKETTVLWHNLRTGRTQSCGCLKKGRCGRKPKQWNSLNLNA